MHDRLELTTARLTAQGLAGPAATSPEAVVDRLLAVQAQDPRGARLAIRARSTGLTAADVDAALTERRSLVVSWLNRGTLHLVAAEDYPWLHALTTPGLRVANDRRLRQTGVGAADAARGIRIVAEACRVAGPQTRNQLRARLDAVGVPTAGQALVHVLFAASIEGHIVRGPMVGGEQAFVDVASWLGEPVPIDRDVALCRLASRYLVGHGPAAAADLARWAGIRLGDARAAFAAIAADVVADTVGLVTLRDTPPPAGLPEPRLLGAFDPILHGWLDRSPLLNGHVRVVTSNGVFHPTALVDGRVVATWRMPGGRIVVEPFEAIAPEAAHALTADGADVRRFLGLVP
jgi:hypothetical protein